MKIFYRVGWPFLKLAYKLGFKLSYRYEIFYDLDCKRFIGVSHDVQGLVAECDTVEEVKAVIEDSAPTMVNLRVYGTTEHNVRKDSLTPHMTLGRLVNG